MEKRRKKSDFTEEAMTERKGGRKRRGSENRGKVGGEVRYRGRYVGGKRR